MADIFISYTSSDKEAAHWIAQELEILGHKPDVWEWQVKAGDDIYAWMQQKHDAADHVLCVVSDEYLRAPFSILERNAALMQAADKRPGFVLLVVVKPCRLPTLSDHLLHCDLFDVREDLARRRLREFLEGRNKPERIPFFGRGVAVTNITILMPLHFMGRDDAITAIRAALGRYEGRVAITALHGMRGVGKTTLAAAYAERYKADYRATWWIEAEKEQTMRDDLVALGVRLGWKGAKGEEEPSLADVLGQLRHHGEGILLIYDNAIDARRITPYLPHGGAVQVLVTSNAHAWGGVAEPVEIRLWPPVIGADYLVARNRRPEERDAAAALSEALGGLPLAHEQAAAYCERMDASFADYSHLLAKSSAKVLDSSKDAPVKYYDGLTVTKTFHVAIQAVALLNSAAEPLIAYLALLAPEPIPLFLLKDGRTALGEPLAGLLNEEGLEEAVAALRSFALVNREMIEDERKPEERTKAIRLHRLVREVAAARLPTEVRDDARRRLIAALTAAYPKDIDGYGKVESWFRCRLLTPHVFSLRADMSASGSGEHVGLSGALNRVGMYYLGRGDLTQSELLLREALAERRNASDTDPADVATSLSNLSLLLDYKGEYSEAEELCRMALSIRKSIPNRDEYDISVSVNNLACLCETQGKIEEAKLFFEESLAITEKMFGDEHEETATALDNIGDFTSRFGSISDAEDYCLRGLQIREKMLGPEYTDTAFSLIHLAKINFIKGEIRESIRLFRRGLFIYRNQLGNNHIEITEILKGFAAIRERQGFPLKAKRHYGWAISLYERSGAPDHPDAKEMRGKVKQELA